MLNSKKLLYRGRFYLIEDTLHNIESTDIVLQSDNYVVTVKNPQKMYNNAVVIDTIIVSKKYDTCLLLNNQTVKQIGCIEGTVLQNTNIYLLFNSLEYYNTYSVCRSIEKIRQIIYKNTNKEWFIVRNCKSNEKHILTRSGLINYSTNSTLLKHISLHDLDYDTLWNIYFWSFIESILVEKL